MPFHDVVVASIYQLIIFDADIDGYIDYLRY